MNQIAIYLTAADAARQLGITTATVRLMHKRGELPVAAMTEGGIRLFNRSDVEQLMRARTRRRPAGQRVPGLDGSTDATT